jgi:hypothetical protein
VPLTHSHRFIDMKPCHDLMSYNLRLNNNEAPD